MPLIPCFAFSVTLTNAIAKPHQSADNQRDDDTEQETHRFAHRLAYLRDVDGVKSGESAHQHHAIDTEVEYAAALGESLAEGGKNIGCGQTYCGSEDAGGENLVQAHQPSSSETGSISGTSCRLTRRLLRCWMKISLLTTKTTIKPLTAVISDAGTPSSRCIFCAPTSNPPKKAAAGIAPDRVQSAEERRHDAIEAGRAGEARRRAVRLQTVLETEHLHDTG